jgi:hypothetical protein
VGLKISGRRYRATVLGPRSLEEGATAILRLRLSKQALAALAGRRATVEVRIEVFNDGGSTSRTVRVRVAGRGSP